MFALSSPFFTESLLSLITPSLNIPDPRAVRGRHVKMVAVKEDAKHLWPTQNTYFFWREGGGGWTLRERSHKGDLGHTLVVTQVHATSPDHGVGASLLSVASSSPYVFGERLKAQGRDYTGKFFFTHVHHLELVDESPSVWTSESHTGLCRLFRPPPGWRSGQPGLWAHLRCWRHA